MEGDTRSLDYSSNGLFGLRKTAPGTTGAFVELLPDVWNSAVAWELNYGESHGKVESEMGTGFM